MEEEQKVLISMPSENNNRRSSVLPFDASRAPHEVEAGCLFH